jgi:hypothetical protein
MVGPHKSQGFVSVHLRVQPPGLSWGVVAVNLSTFTSHMSFSTAPVACVACMVPALHAQQECYVFAASPDVTSHCYVCLVLVLCYAVFRCPRVLAGA